jgi:G:T-mismatch repair DNA endonuclease (very short patch repair protein)
MSLQGRWKHSREDIISQTIGKYVDLSKSKVIKLEALLQAEPELTKGVASKIAAENLGRLSAVPQTSEKYWLQRGWPAGEAVLKARERKLAGVRSTKNILSPFGREHWLAKINPATGRNYTIEEADYKRNSRRPIRKEYWLEKGHTDAEACRLAAQTKDRNNRNGGTKGSRYALRTVGYFLARGYTEAESIILLADAQATFSLEKLIKKRGVIEGTGLWKARQEKWQATLNAKPFEQQECINQRKICKAGSMSKISQLLFEKINYKGARWGKKTATNRGEMMIRLDEKRRVMIDFSLGNKLIEFYGDYWHANPSKYEERDVINTRKNGAVSAADIWKQNKERKQALEALGYELFIVWEHDFKTQPNKVIEECNNFLNT